MSDWDTYSAITKALLDRFVTSNSISISGESYDNKPGVKKQDAITYSIPNSKLAKQIRESWTDDRRSIPKEGIVFPDGSIMTILFVAKGLPFEKLLTPVRHHIAISDNSNNMIEYVEKYSYCFYPNSQLADSIGYFRYDFHVDNMGDGDLGEHTYFHFHRQLEESFRHATGPILDCGEVVSGLERVLAKKERQARLEKAFNAGNFDALQMDLTIEGIQQLCETLYPSKSFKKFKHRQKYDDFLEALVCPR
jgi:hypothetical protein